MKFKYILLSITFLQTLLNAMPNDISSAISFLYIERIISNHPEITHTKEFHYYKNKVLQKLEDQIAKNRNKIDRAHENASKTQVVVGFQLVCAACSGAFGYVITQHSLRFFNDKGSVQDGILGSFFMTSGAALLLTALLHIPELFPQDIQKYEKKIEQDEKIYDAISIL